MSGAERELKTKQNKTKKKTSKKKTNKTKSEKITFDCHFAHKVTCSYFEAENGHYQLIRNWMKEKER